MMEFTYEYVCELPVDGMASFVSGSTTIPVREPIVRCRDCKHFTPNKEFWVEPPKVPFPIIGATFDSCDFWAETDCKVEPEGFCKWGERTGE